MLAHLKIVSFSRILQLGWPGSSDDDDDENDDDDNDDDEHDDEDQNCNISANFQTRRSRFCMVIDQHNT